MAAVVAKEGKIRFTADGDTHTPIANLQVYAVTVTDTASIGAVVKIRRFNSTGEILFDYIGSTVADASETSTHHFEGCFTTTKGLYCENATGLAVTCYVR